MPIRSLKLDSLSFAYGESTALESIDLEIASGQILGVVGANGAGKSTLVKIIAGLLSGYRGTISVNGRPASLGSPATSIDAGIAVSMQEPEFAWNLSVNENCRIRCSNSRTKKGTIGASSWLNESISTIKVFGCESILDTVTGSLDRRSLQILQLSLVLSQPADILVLDEPTTALTEDDRTKFFTKVKTLSDLGASILFISHEIEDVLKMSSSVMVLRDGKNYSERLRSETNEEAVVNDMYGAGPAHHSWKLASRINYALRSLRLSTRHICDFNLDIFRGEIVGVVNTDGYATELFQALAGLEPITSGTIFIGDRTCVFQGPQEAIEAGIGYLVEDRRRDGVFPNLSILQNMVISSLDMFSSRTFFNAQQAASRARPLTTELRLKHPGFEKPIGTLSGGNQQKVMLIRLLLSGASIMLLEEPTAGMDSKSRLDLYKGLRLLAGRGIGILASSQDATELSEFCDRVCSISFKHHKLIQFTNQARER